MRLFTKEEMLNFLRQLKMGVENGSYMTPAIRNKTKKQCYWNWKWLLKPRNTCLKKTERNRQVQAPAA